MIFGDNGNDIVSGGLGDDDLHGGAHNDRLAGGAGQDMLTGDAGRDALVVAAGSGADQVTGFGDTQDRIDLSAYGFASGFADRTFMADVAGDLVFTNGTDVLTIAAMTKAQISGPYLIL